VSEASAGALPSLAETRGWLGLGLDDVAGGPVGRVEGVYADAESGSPVWLVVVTGERKRGRLRFLGRGEAKTVLVPLRECAAMPTRAWTAQPLHIVRSAPSVDAGRPLLQEHEVAIAEHYGIGAQVGRHAEVAARPPGTVTAQPA
jgi:hypothetical protein